MCEKQCVEEYDTYLRVRNNVASVQSGEKVHHIIHILDETIESDVDLHESTLNGFHIIPFPKIPYSGS